MKRKDVQLIETNRFLFIKLLSKKAKQSVDASVTPNEFSFPIRYKESIKKQLDEKNLTY